jgi:hypothetical protein
MTIIRVPVDATQVPESERAKQKVRVALRSGEEIASRVVSVEAGRAEAEFNVEASGPVTIAVGPESSDAADLFRRSTPTVTVRPTGANGERGYTVQPIVISRPIWEGWLIWCRTFTITGYVYGTDSNPVPGAQVVASNVDWFWWWTSTSQVGTAVTDANGFFQITFTWCCHWLPWYWWELRDWMLDPILIEKINPVLAMSPNLRVSAPSSALELSFSALNPQPLPPRAQSRVERLSNSTSLSPTTIPALRQKLLGALPDIPEFQRLRLWPWYPWAPWFDCDPNIIFKVTQVCDGTVNVILNESVFQARWDIPIHLNVSLTANEDACTTQTGTQPNGACFVFIDACGFLPGSGEIGPGDDPPVVGLADPMSEDRPFTGTVNVDGYFGTGVVADYYGVEYRAAGFPNANPFQPVPINVLQAFGVDYFDATLSFPNQIVPVTFAPQTLPLNGGGTAAAYQTLINYEENNGGVGAWGSAGTRTWLEPDFQATFSIDSALLNPAEQGAYEFQIVGYTYSGGVLTSLGAPAPCGKPGADGFNGDNDLALYFDNPIPSLSDPVASIDGVTLAGTVLTPCAFVNVPASGTFSLIVEFTASDPNVTSAAVNGFLDNYSLTLQHGVEAPVTLIPAAATSTLAGSTAGTFPGPTYSLAISQGASRPSWPGGSMILTITNAASLFPETCAYELTLTVNKRNIVNCEAEFDEYQATGYYSFTVIVA